MDSSHLQDQAPLHPVPSAAHFPDRPTQALRSNQLLASLPSDEYARIFPELELVSLPLGESLSESGVLTHHAYFPTDAIVSLLYVMEDGASAEIAVVGNEGSSASPCSWAAKPPPAGPWCKAPVRPTG
jgi:hypothetical protein